MWFELGWASLAVANIFDAVSSIMGLSRGKTDLNPIVNWAYSKAKGFGVVGLKLAYFAFLILLYNLYMKQPPPLDPNTCGQINLAGSAIFWFASFMNYKHMKS